MPFASHAPQNGHTVRVGHLRALLHMQHPLPGCTGRSGGGSVMVVMLGMPESFKQNDLDNVTAYTGKLVKEEVGLVTLGEDQKRSTATAEHRQKGCGTDRGLKTDPE
jgi:hypothetical protein